MNSRPKKDRLKLPPEFLPPLNSRDLPPDRCPVPREEASPRILIVRTGSHGDILMATPLLSTLRRTLPGAQLTWLVERTEQQAIDANPYIDEVLLWDSGWFRRLMKPLRRPLWPLRTWAFRRELRRRNFDVLISFQPEEWPFLLDATAAPVTIGVFDTFRQFQNQSHTSPLAKRYTHAFTYDTLPAHRTEQYLLPLKALGIPEASDKTMQMGFTEDDATTAEQFLAGNGVGRGESFAVVAPMTTWASRCWDGGRYAQLGDALADRGCRVIMIGSPRGKEREQIAEIVARMRHPPVQALGVLTFRQMAALIARAACVVSGDTGPMHVAAAVGTPYVALFGPTPVDGRAPLAGRGITLMHPVPCGPCDQEVCPNAGENHMRCMRLLTVPEVLTATEQYLPSPVLMKSP